MKQLALTILLALLACCPPGASLAQNATSGQIPTLAAPATRLGDYLANQPAEDEKKRILAVLGEFHAGDAADNATGAAIGNAVGNAAVNATVNAMGNATDRLNAGMRFTGSRARFVSPREAYLLSLKKNLSIRVSQKNAAIAMEAIQEAEAVYDPVLSLTFTYSETDTNERTKEIYLQTKKFYPPAEIAIPTNPFNSEPQIVAIGWRQQQEGIRSLNTVYASKDPDNGPTTAFNYNLSVAQKLPWGPRLNLDLNIRDQDVYYDTSGHSYDQPWASTFVADLVTPLPFTKGFGPDSPNDAAIKLSKKQSEIGELNVRTAINSILYETDLAYWNVVRRFENLCVIIERRKLLDQRMDMVDRRYRNREATTYDRLQVESALAQSKVLEMDAANALFDASYVLADLIEDDKQAQSGFLYLPYDYLALLDRVESPDLSGALGRAMAERPELKAGTARIEEAAINRDYAENQLRPDLTATGGYTAAQDASVYGYSNPIKSLNYMDRVDKESYYGTLEYQYPILNRALDARFEQARLGVRQAGLSRRITKNSIIREVGDAAAQVATSQSRMQSAGESVKFAALAYDKVQKQQEFGEVSEFEALLALQRLSEAQLSQVLARIDYRTALTGLSAATGELASASADRVSDQDLDQYRLEILNSSNSLNFFSKPSSNQEPAP